MAQLELRDFDAARAFIAQGLWLQRAVRPRASGVRAALEWSLEIVDAGHPLPAIGMVSDLVNVVLAIEREPARHRDFTSLPGLPSGLVRTYEDVVLGKAIADASLIRAGDAVRHLQGRDRARAAAYIVIQSCERIGFRGVMLSPAVIKSLLDSPADEVLSRGWESLNRGVQPLLVELYEDSIAKFRQAADLLAPEDVFELEHGTALIELGQRVALRQILQIANKLEISLPVHQPRPVVNRRDVATRLVDEDNYPVGGFASISNRGSIESLLHSQLAYMEPTDEDRPDLFDMKFLRDELLYYSRDENQFLRRRRSFVFVLSPDLAQARFKDIELPTQRIIVALAMLIVAVRKLTSWLSTEALTFDFIFVADGDAQPLGPEESLLRMLLREPIANGTVQLKHAPHFGAAGVQIAEHARRSQCQALILGVAAAKIPVDHADINWLLISSARPRFFDSDDDRTPNGDDSWDVWRCTLEKLLELWV